MRHNRPLRRSSTESAAPRATPPPAILETLYHISRLDDSADSPHHALTHILNEILRALPQANSGSISLIAPESGQLDIDVAINLPESARHSALRIGQGVTGWVALHGEPLLVPDTTRDPRYREIRPETRSEIAAPMRDRKQIIGVINLDSDRPNAFSQDDLESLAHLSNEAARVIGNLWRTEQLRSRAAHLESVLSIGQHLVGRLDLSGILDSIAHQARSLTDCSACAILLLEPAGHCLKLHSTSGIKPRQHPDLPLNETSAGITVARQKQTEVFDLLKTEENLHLLRAAQECHLASALFTPITIEEKVTGVIALYTDKEHRFDDQEKSLVSIMANLGAVAVNNARLYARVLQGEESLRRNEKLTTLGLLAAEVAHEIRNPLTVIKLLFQSLNPNFSADDPRARDQRVIEEKLNHLDTIVGRVLNFARTSGEIRSRVSLNEMIDDTLALVRVKAAQSVTEIQFDPATEELHVNGNKGQLQQVLLNLLLNSLEAVGQNGKITISTGKADTEGSPGAWFEVSDTGTGIPEELRDQVFESFLTDRPNGSGLGLAIARQIVSAHHGSIQIVATGPTGTRIKTWLPT